jgi:hypothetical protein
MRNTKLQYWLARHKPHSLIAVDEDGKEYKLSVSKKKNRWSLVIKAVAACNAVKLMAYDADGSLGPCCDIDKRGEAIDEDEDPENFDPTAQTVPKGFDFASILATAMHQANENSIEAADRAIARHEAAYAGRRDDMREAMAQFGVVVKLTTDRLVHLEKAWHTLLMRQQELGGAVDPADELAMTVIDRAFREPKEKDEANGKEHTNGAPARTQKPKPEPLT